MPVSNLKATKRFSGFQVAMAMNSSRYRKYYPLALFIEQLLSRQYKVPCWKSLLANGQLQLAYYSVVTPFIYCRLTVNPKIFIYYN